eukprot:TRINITY_DN68335_c0_g1_i1.p1 TRINITY_DN68335_c0_g1~~TRINITY_DN68335_c0_g1_i1.p1  ORF type:complete len:290 (-),score=18.64 TRINITY_DN68335_c0_g1_i1:129-932(-)
MVKEQESSKPDVMTAAKLHDLINIVVLSIIFAMCVGALQHSRDSPWHSIVIAVTSAYLIGDCLWICLEPDMVKTPKSIIAHHVVTFIVLLDPITIPTHRENASRALLVEINTVLLTLRRWLGRPIWCEIGFYLTWAYIRLVYFPSLGLALLASSLEADEQVQSSLPAVLRLEVRGPPIRWFASICFAAVVVLQFYWTLAMGKTMIKGKDVERSGSGKGDSSSSSPARAFSMRVLLIVTLLSSFIAAGLLRYLFDGASSPLVRQTSEL